MSKMDIDEVHAALVAVAGIPEEHIIEGKPSWDEAPDDANILCRSQNGVWVFGRAMRVARDPHDGAWVIADMDEDSQFYMGYREGEVIGVDSSLDWEGNIEIREGCDVDIVDMPQGKPSWDEAPDGAEILILVSGSGWRFGSYKDATIVAVSEGEGIAGIGMGDWLGNGRASTEDEDMAVAEELLYVEYRTGEKPSVDHIQLKPTWDDAPAGANVLVKSPEGVWVFGTFRQVELARSPVNGIPVWMPVEGTEREGDRWFDEKRSYDPSKSIYEQVENSVEYRIQAVN